MREEKPKSTSQKKKSTQRKSWFWPVVYSGIAIVFVGMIWGYNAFINQDTLGVTDSAKGKPGTDGLVVETAAQKEALKYPFVETLLDDVVIVQEYYDPEASEEMREKALLVFNQSYVTLSGVSISIDGKPFEVLAAMSGTVEDVIVDAFTGSEILVTHADGLQTVYSSVAEVLVKPGDLIIQGQALGTATENEWNPTAGIHLHFEVLQDGETVNPRLLLAF